MKCFWSPRRRSLKFLTFLAASSAMSGTAISGDSRIAEVKVAQGVLAGQTVGDLRIFRGIPFAAPPVRERRWRAPEPAKSWTGVRDARTFASACFQSPNPIMNVPSQAVSEDCLYLNVWTPAHSGKGRLPVVVWIHGGGFAYGSTAMPLFDGAALARKGVVVVSIAYRVGPFGFLVHPELSAESRDRVSGNYGILDQIAALRWIRTNIAAFGGNPGRVTIMGQSAGGVSVSFLVQSPIARGLFTGAIAQSGAAMSSNGPAHSLPAAEQSGLDFARRAGVNSLAELRRIPPGEILKAAKATGAFTLQDFWPVLDGHVLPIDSISWYQNRRHNDVPILMGNNDLEGTIFAHAKTLAEFESSVHQQYGTRAAEVLAAYPASTDYEAEQASAALTGDAMFGVLHWTWARLQSRFGRSRLFYYHFEHSPPVRPGFAAGPVHGAELAYVFGTMERLSSGRVSAADFATSDRIMTYWTNFATTGSPNSPGLPHWPAFNEAQPAVMHFTNEGTKLGPVPHHSGLVALDRLDRPKP